jgi:predicted Zn-dependent protease
MRNALATLLALGLFGLACATNPVTGKKEISLVSESQEAEVGKQALAATEAEFGYYDDATWNSKVSYDRSEARVGLAPAGLPWQFHVIDDPTVNAFAAPGGYIFITRGILAHLNSEAQLAGVLGHEIGHVTARHYAAQASNQTLAGLGLGVASILSPTVARVRLDRPAGTRDLFLKYGRDQESQADQLGVDYSVKGGWDAREMPGTYHTLARIGAASGSTIPTYLSTHPDPAAREATTRQLAAQAVGSRTDLKVVRDGYIRSLEGLVYGEDPRDGYFEGDRFYHPRMALQMDFPRAGSTRTPPDRDGGDRGPAQRDAAHGRFDRRALARAVRRAARQQGKITGAQGQNETIGGWPAWVGRVSVQDEQGNSGTLAFAMISTGQNQALQIHRAGGRRTR